MVKYVVLLTVNIPEVLLTINHNWGIVDGKWRWYIVDS